MTQITVIMATYNMPDWLDKVLLGYEVQSDDAFDVIVADDGSGPDTQAIIERYQNRGKLSITHLWHADEGYRRQTILNQAIVQASGEYIVFTDGDCVPRSDFVAVHRQQMERGRFLSGGYCKLPMHLSHDISPDDIVSQRCFNTPWLKAKGLRGASQLRKLGAKGRRGRFLDWITPAGATFNNCNSSAWRSDLMSVNGYDERMQYGGPDREIGERLENMGVSGKQIRHRAVCLHLDHARGYKTKESLERNLRIRENTKKQRIVRTPFGIER